MTPSADLSAAQRNRPRVRVDSHECIPLDGGWQLAAAAPDTPIELGALNDAKWLPARVPGTAAAALADASRWRPGEQYDFDSQDWWFRTSFPAPPKNDDDELWLCLDGLATVAEVHLNGELLLRSDSMFARHELNIGARLQPHNELTIRFCALAPLLEISRRPRARWRTQLANGSLRFFRTMLLGRAPGFAPGPATVGPWREVRIERRRTLVVEDLRSRTRLRGDDGVLQLSARIRSLQGQKFVSATLHLDGPSGAHSAPLTLSAAPDGAANEHLLQGELVVPAVAHWWPHTHGRPSLHEVRIVLDGAQGPVSIGAGRVGFRELSFGACPDHDLEREGLDIHINGVPVFARGAVWTPRDIVSMAPSDAELRETLVRAREAGMNMLRIPGTAAYESEAFHDLCDELGMLVWQDFMFANFDYPTEDEDFLALVTAECRQTLADIAGRPSLAVLCGSSEIEQQVAMLGLDPALARSRWFAEQLPELVRESECDAIYVPSAPCCGELPFRPDSGVANYYGVGGYRRPLTDARRAGVLFAAECLAFSNVPDEAAIQDLVGPNHAHPHLHDPAWKAGVPRDNGADWDFEDVRDHYLQELFALDPVELRSVNHERYLELSRAASGIAMAETFGEWRSAESTCHGALVLWLSDLLPGAGWGVLDHRGTPKAAYRHLARALAPVAVWTIDEGLGGVAVHAANDRPEPLKARLRVALYSDFQRPVGEAECDVELPAHGHASWNVETLLGRFVDASWAYRFGPPAQDAIFVSLTIDDSERARSAPLSQTSRFPAGYPIATEHHELLGLRGVLRPTPVGSAILELSSARVAFGVRIHLPGWEASDDCIDLEPGHTRTIALLQLDPQAPPNDGGLSALNMDGRVEISVEEQR
jgi:beta-mannosidase